MEAEFGKKLSSLRKQHGMSQAELAEALDVSRQAVSKWEQGAALPATDNLLGMSALFEISVDALVGREPPAGNVAVEEPGRTPSRQDGARGVRPVFKWIALAVCAAAVLFAIGGAVLASRSQSQSQNPVPMEDLERKVVDLSPTEDFSVISTDDP